MWGHRLSLPCLDLLCIGSVRAVVQRVSEASVTIVDDGRIDVVGTVGQGLCVLVGVTHDDTPAAAEWLAGKVWNLRIFEDHDGVMNRSARDVGAEILVVSQFTLYGDTSAGRRPSWTAAARPDVAEPLVDHLVATLRGLGAGVATGRFRADMQVSLVNDGPVTVIVESPSTTSRPSQRSSPG
jgi:D-tyrosyl-tRNA(Tyr) deacylase